MIQMDGARPEDLVLSQHVRRMTSAEFAKALDAGVFDSTDVSDPGVELLFGVVVQRRKRGAPHEESVYRVQRALSKQLDDRAVVRSQSLYYASTVSVPVPDIFVTPSGSYWDKLPNRAYLVVEVSRSSLGTDRVIKRALYALGRRVDEYWIVNHRQRCVEVYRDPRGRTWRDIAIRRPGEKIVMLAFPDVKIAVSDILPPA